MSKHADTTPSEPLYDLSGSWREVYNELGCDSDIIAAATRPDHPPRYRRKHIQGVSS